MTAENASPPSLMSATDLYVRRGLAGEGAQGVSGCVGRKGILPPRRCQYLLIPATLNVASVSS